MDETSMEVTRWERTDFFKVKPSVEELIRIHQRLHQYDEFAQVMYSYPFGKDIMPNTIRKLIPRTDYEFFLARLPESQEILGWIALSFNKEGSEAENKEIYEARLEPTQMYSHILKGWKADNAGEKSNVWEMMKRISSSLRAKHLPRHYCIINTLVVLPEYQQSGVVDGLVERAIEYWKRSVAVGTEWAMWVQAPPFTRYLYMRYGFEEVGDYEVELGDYGFFSKQEREVSGLYEWRFMVRREASGSAIREPEGAEKSDKDKGKERESEDVEEHVPTRKQGKGKGKEQESEDVEEHVATRKYNKGKGKEQWIDNSQAQEPVHPAYGDPSVPLAERMRAWKEANERLYGDPSESDAERTLTWDKANERLKDMNSAEARQVAGQHQYNWIPSKSAESIIEGMRKGGVDEEDIEQAKSLAISLEEAKGES